MYPADGGSDMLLESFLRADFLQRLRQTWFVYFRGRSEQSNPRWRSPEYPGASSLYAAAGIAASPNREIIPLLPYWLVESAVLQRCIDIAFILLVPNFLKRIYDMPVLLTLFPFLKNLT